MKRFYTLSLIPLFSFAVYAQNIKVLEPEYSGDIVFINDSIGSGIPLEKKTTNIEIKTSALTWIPIVGLFVGKSTSSKVVKGCCSNVIIPKKKNIQLIIKVDDYSQNPQSYIKIFSLIKKENCRQNVLYVSKTFGGAKEETTNYIEYTAQKYGISSYLIEIPNIESGEYAINLYKSIDFNLFQIQ